jgi:Ca-activated chloride channel homolog
MVSVAFLYPKFLLLLLLVPFFIFIYFFSLVYTRKKAMVFANFEAMQRFYDMEFFSRNFLALYSHLIIIVLMVFAVAGTSVAFDAETSTFSYALAIDNSGSMKTADVLPTRLDAAKTSAKKFTDWLPVGVEIGVMSFAGDAEILQGLDSSKIRARMAIDRIEFGDVHGTNIYNAVISANSLFGDRRMKSLIILSDGQLNIGDAPQIIKYANRNNLVINTIAMGTEEGGVTDLNTISKVDIDFLKSLAFNTNGKFFQAQDLNQLDESFVTLVREVNRDVSIDLTFYLMFGALGLFTINWIFRNLRFRIVP